jgi:hypothetical protein
MGVLDFFGIGKTVGQAAGEVADAGTKIVNAFKGKDPELDRALVELTTKTNEAQARINEENAKLGRGNWRSALGWVGVYAIAYHYILAPTLYAFGLKIPVLDIGELVGLVVLLLGGAGIKVAEKKLMQ